MRRALLIGINAYAQAPLRGCVNDALDWCGVLSEVGFRSDDVCMLIDERATRENIIKRAVWLRAGCRPGDELVFGCSSHGTRLSIGGQIQDCLVPIDFDWNDARTFVSAADLDTAFFGLPAGVKLTVILDACHSGDMRELSALARRQERTRFLPPPRPSRGLGVRGFGGWLRVDESMDHLLLAACRSDQTAADSTFGVTEARPNGAFTRMLIDSLRLSSARTWLQVMEDARGLLKSEGFEQEPQLVAAAKFVNSYPFNGRM